MELIAVELVRGAGGGERLGRLPIRGPASSVFVMQEPADKDRHVAAFATLGGSPEIMERAADAVGRGLQPNLGLRGIRHGLERSGYMLLGPRPECYLGAVEVLHSVRASDTLSL